MKKALLMSCGLLACGLVADVNQANAQTPSHQHATDWAKWAYSVEASKNPVLDATNADCSINQKGDVWYLGGQLEAKTSTRRCTIAQGKTLAILVIGKTAFNTPGLCGQRGNKSPIQLKTETLTYMAGVKDVYAEVNDKRLASAKIIRTQSQGVFALTLPEDNIQDKDCGGYGNVPAGTYSPADNSGYYAIVDSLPVGKHTIKTHALRQGKKHQIRYDITVKADGQGGETDSPLPTVSVEGLGVTELARLMEEGKLTSKQLVNYYLKRIEEIDKSGPALNSVLQLNPDALSIAQRLDQERKSKGSRGPLHGIPVLLKANIDTADKLETTAGSLALKGHKASKDAFFVAQLRAKGAIILGKTNMTEWANFLVDRASFSGWSALGGQTKNPYVLDRNTCGSSSGSAVAVAAELAPLSVGTQTMGSLICPAGVSGVVAMKPSVGLISREGIIPISFSLDSAGPMAKNVKDVAIMLQSMVGIDSNDVIGKDLPKDIPDYLSQLTSIDLKKVRIGVLRDYYGFKSEKADAKQTIETFNQAVTILKSLGAQIITDAGITSHSNYMDNTFDVQLYEFHYGINRYLQSHGSPNGMSSLADLMKFNQQNKVTAIKNYNQGVFGLAMKKGPLTEDFYKKLLKFSHQGMRSQIDKAFAAKQLDIVIGPTNSPIWKTDLTNGDDWNDFIGTEAVPDIAGYPVITVPMGLVNKLPVGISFIGPLLSEQKLLRIAYAFEQASKKRAKPQFLPTRE